MIVFFCDTPPHHTHTHTPHTPQTPHTLHRTHTNPPIIVTIILHTFRIPEAPTDRADERSE